MKRIAILLVLLALTACEPTDEQVAHMREVLPPGCLIQDLGPYGNVSHVIMVQCSGRQSRAESYMQQAGKTQVPIASIQIDPR